MNQGALDAWWSTAQCMEKPKKEFELSLKRSAVCKIFIVTSTLFGHCWNYFKKHFNGKHAFSCPQAAIVEGFPRTMFPVKQNVRSRSDVPNTYSFAILNVFSCGACLESQDNILPRNFLLYPFVWFCKFFKTKTLRPAFPGQGRLDPG